MIQLISINCDFIGRPPILIMIMLIILFVEIKMHQFMQVHLDPNIIALNPLAASVCKFNYRADRYMCMCIHVLYILYMYMCTYMHIYNKHKYRCTYMIVSKYSNTNDYFNEHILICVYIYTYIYIYNTVYRYTVM